MSTVVYPGEDLEGALRRFRAELGAEEVLFEAQLRQCFRTHRERRYRKRQHGQGPHRVPGKMRHPAKRLESFVEAWIVGAEAEANSPEYLANRWALSNLSIAAVFAPETAWRLILTILHHQIPPRSFYFLAADPLETLLVRHGSEFIDRAEMWARIDPEFKELLGAVWKNAIADDIWQRIQHVTRSVTERELRVTIGTRVP